MHKLALAASLFVSFTAFADKPAPKGEAKTDPAHDAAMAAMQKFATPTDAHKAMVKSFAGSWTTAQKFWMGGPKPQESAGTAEVKAVLGDRYLEESIKSTFMGQPFEGRGWTGIDNRTNKWVWNWVDTAGTGILHAEGTPDAAGKTITFLADDINPETNKPMKVKFLLKIESDKKHTLEMYENGPDGKEHKSFEIVYSRK